jgi:hypothetical protein
MARLDKLLVTFAPNEAAELMDLFKWAKGQGYHAFSEHAKKNGVGLNLRVAAAKLAVVTRRPDWEC